jgi:hypothetical protein
VERLDRAGVAGRGGLYHLGCGPGQAREPGGVALEAGAREPGLHAPRLAAVAGLRVVALLVGHPGERVVAPLPGHLVGTVENPPSHRDPAAHTGAEYDAEDDLRPLSRPVDRLAQGEAVGVVGHPDRASEPRLDVCLERTAVEPDRVGVLDQTGGAGDDPGDADAHRAGPAGLPLQLGDQAGDGVEGAVVVAGGGKPAAGSDDVLGGESDGFDLGPAEVDADLHVAQDRRRLSLWAAAFSIVGRALYWSD